MLIFFLNEYFSYLNENFVYSYQSNNYHLTLPPNCSLSGIEPSLMASLWHLLKPSQTMHGWTFFKQARKCEIFQGGLIRDCNLGAAKNWVMWRNCAIAISIGPEPHTHTHNTVDRSDRWHLQLVHLFPLKTLRRRRVARSSHMMMMYIRIGPFWYTEPLRGHLDQFSYP